MKLRLHPVFWALLLIPLMGIDCWGGPPLSPETNYVPVLMARSEMERAVALLGPRGIKSPGKIYFKDGIVYLTEKYRGLHIIDNRNPEQPEVKAFVRVPGISDVAAKGDRMYLDAATDMLVFDISNPLEPIFRQRVRNTFPEIPPPDLGDTPEAYQPWNRADSLIIVRWEE